MALRDRLLDEAIAIAKACSHPEVEPRHVLWAIVQVVGPEALSGITPAAVRPYLEPSGVAVKPPGISEAAQASIDLCTSVDAAAAEAHAISERLASSRGEGPAAAIKSGPAATSVVAQAEPATAAQAVVPSSGDSNRESVVELLAELDSLVGLASVKAEIRKVVAVQRLNAERLRIGLPEVTGSSHLVFTGDPGTGKTTVARLVARLYGAIGLVSRGHLVEATRGDLVAGYVGQTALKVQEVVSSAVGGVLFIDEAYALSQGESIDYGGEAVATLVKMMEDNRQNLAVIVAGYRDEMWTFIRSNPGLRSRFTKYIDFANYSTSELVQIFEAMTAVAKVRVDAGVRESVAAVLGEARSVEDFGNARYVRSMFELAYANMAARALADDRVDPDELDLLTVGDLPQSDPAAGDQGRRIGFRAP